MNIKVTPKIDEQTSRNDIITVDETLKLIDSNRARLRSLAGNVLTICGFLLSAAFVVLTFTLTNVNFRIPRAVHILLFSSAITLTFAIFFSVASAFLLPPKGAASKTDLVQLYGRIHQREYRNAVIAVVCLMLALLFFLAALIVFAVNVIYQR
jgi:hypothetical protein